MRKNKFYAVVKGHRPGIYDEWFGARGAEANVRGFAGARYKGFTSLEEAEAWFTELSAETGTARQSRPPVSREASSRRSKPAIKEPPDQSMAADKGHVVVYTDGGCSRNPGPGGYGVVLLYGDGRKELSGGYARTTNNRMELTACIKGLEVLEGKCPVTVFCDSRYVVNGIEKGWARRWKRNNWKRNETDTAENSDLWSRLLDLCEKHDVSFRWVRGHDGNTENERCDELAVEMTRRGDLPPDRGYDGKSGRPD
jgi:ribonuclease HI